MDELVVDALDGESGDKDLVTVRYWAGARAAAGTEQEAFAARDVAELRALAEAAHPGLRAVLPRCSFLVDGKRSDDAVKLQPGSLVEVLPPFAGG